MSTTDAPNSAPDVQSSAERPQPRLSILHLLVWTALAALVLAEWKLRMFLIESLRLNIDTRLGFDAAFQSLLEGANLGGLVLLFARRRRGIRFPVEPGEWLLVMQGASIVLTTLITTLWLYIYLLWPNSHRGHLSIDSYALILVGVAQFLVPAILCQRRGMWRWFFWFATAMYSLQLADLVALDFINWPGMFTFNMQMVASYSVCGLVLAAAAVQDWRRHLRLDWVHWLRVTTMLVSIVWDLCNWTPELWRR